VEMGQGRGSERKTRGRWGGGGRGKRERVMR